MDFLEAMNRRNSYRGEYTPEAVPRADLKTILTAGLAAPSGCNRQTTSLIAVDDPAVLARLREILGHAVGDTAPAMICVLARRIIAYRNRTYYMQDYAAAIENMLLTITALGYESCWVEGYITDADRLGWKMADVLGVPEDYEMVCYLPVGRAAEAPRHAEKLPFEKRAWFNAFPAVNPDPRA
jgi:nitroreductase